MPICSMHIGPICIRPICSMHIVVIASIAIVAIISCAPATGVTNNRATGVTKLTIIERQASLTVGRSRPLRLYVTVSEYGDGHITAMLPY